MTTITAPHPALQNALFCYATGHDGANAILLRGWEALVLKVEEEVACGPDDKWRDHLADLDEWQDDGWDTPHRYTCTFEDGYMSIYTVSGNLPNDAPVPEEPTTEMLEAVLKEHPGSRWGYAVQFAKDWRAAVAAFRAGK